VCAWPQEKRVVLRAGAFHLGGGLEAPLVLGPEASGLELIAAPGEEAVVTGGVEIRPKWQRWRSSNDNILVADIPAQLLRPGGAAISELIVGGRRMMTAREPDADVYLLR